jgi:hypothetical protein
MAPKAAAFLLAITKARNHGYCLCLFAAKKTKVTVAGKPSPKAKLDGDKIEGAGAPDAN